MTYRAAINQALGRIMDENQNVILIGQSIRDPFGGAYKVTRGLSTRFPERVLDYPISEAAMIGVGLGMAMAGKIPIVEIMFADFLTLCVDQIYNIGQKMREHHGIKFKMIIRTMVNNDEMYGVTHSQDMDWLLNILPTARWNLDLDDDPYSRYDYLCRELDNTFAIIVERKEFYDKEIV